MLGTQREGEVMASVGRGMRTGVRTPASLGHSWNACSSMFLKAALDEAASSAGVNLVVVPCGTYGGGEPILPRSFELHTRDAAR